MGDNAWKAYERYIASLFNTRRNPLSGANNAGRTGDVIHPDLNIECKNHSNPTINKWLKKAKEESENPPLVFVHTKNRPYRTSSVTMPLEDFLKIKEDYMRKVVNKT